MPLSATSLANVHRVRAWLCDSSLPKPKCWPLNVGECNELVRISREEIRIRNEEMHIRMGLPAVPRPAAVVDNDNDHPSRLGGDESLVPDANASDEVLPFSEDESDSDDGLPRPAAWKSPAVPWVGSSGAGKGKRPSSVGIALADTAEWQQEVNEEDDEEEGNDDDDDDYAPARPSRRAADKQPARISAAPAPAISSRKASSWSDAEDQACIKFMKEICTEKRYAAIAGTEKRFEVVAERMKRDHSFNRTASGVKLQWNRRLRAISGFEDRGEKKHSGSGLTTSSLVKGTKSGTLAATSLVASTPPDGTNVSASPAQSTETSNSATSVRQRKRKIHFVDSEDEEDDFIPAARSAKRSRTSSVIPSTQDPAFYDISSENIITTPRSSRHKHATTIEASDDEQSTSRPSRKQRPTTTAPARSSHPRRGTVIDNDEEDNVEQVTAASRVPARSSRQKRSTTETDGEDKEQASIAPAPKRHKMSDFSPMNKCSKRDGRLLNRREREWWVDNEYYLRPANEVPVPAPALNSKAYWAQVLLERQQKVAKLRETAEHTNEDDSEDDDEPIISTADKAKKNRELLRQKSSAAANASSRRFSPQLSDIVEQSENIINEDNDNDNDYAGDAEDQDNVAAAQLAADEELARQIQAELNGEARPRRGHGFN